MALNGPVLLLPVAGTVPEDAADEAADGVAEALVLVAEFVAEFVAEPVVAVAEEADVELDALLMLVNSDCSSEAALSEPPEDDS